MSSKLLPFLCGGVVGVAAASVVWSVSTSPSEKPVPDLAKPVPAAEPIAEEPVPAAEAEPAAEPVPVAEAEPEEKPVPVAEPAPAAKPVPVSAEPVPAEAERPQRRGPPRWEEMTDEQREEMRQRFRRMHDEHATRVVESFVERNGLEPEDGERLFAVVDSMNERALARVQLWIDYAQVQDGERMSRDQGARLMRDLFDDLVKGYEDLDETFGTDWREKSPDFDLGQMVDPEVWGSLFRLGGAMGGPGGFGRGRGPGRGGPPRRGGGAPGAGGNAP